MSAGFGSSGNHFPCFTLLRLATGRGHQLWTDLAPAQFPSMPRSLSVPTAPHLPARVCSRLSGARIPHLRRKRRLPAECDFAPLALSRQKAADFDKKSATRLSACQRVESPDGISRFPGTSCAREDSNLRPGGLEVRRVVYENAGSASCLSHIWQTPSAICHPTIRGCLLSQVTESSLPVCSAHRRRMLASIGTEHDAYPSSGCGRDS